MRRQRERRAQANTASQNQSGIINAYSCSEGIKKSLARVSIARLLMSHYALGTRGSSIYVETCFYSIYTVGGSNYYKRVFV